MTGILELNLLIYIEEILFWKQNHKLLIRIEEKINKIVNSFFEIMWKSFKKI